MSKHKTKKVRKVNYCTLTTNEPAPEVGGITEYKDAIIVRKQTDDSVEVFYTDQNGKVMKTITTNNLNNIAMKTKLILTKVNPVATLIKNNDLEKAIIVKNITIYSKNKNRRIVCKFLGDEYGFASEDVYNDNYVKSLGMSYDGHEVRYGKDIMAEIQAISGNQELTDDDKALVIVDYEFF